MTGRRHPITLVTSLLPKEGKSLVASALARSLASGGLRTLLVDLNGRNSRYQLSLDLRCHSPLSLQDYLEGSATARQVAVQVDGASPLFLMTNRDAKATDLATLSGAKLRTRFAALRKEFDAIVIDAPALESLSDAFQVAAIADEVVLAVLAGNQQLEKLRDDVAKIRARSAHVKGVIVVDETEPDTDELAHIRGYTISEPLREIWPKPKKSARFFGREWKVLRGASKIFGRRVVIEDRAEASI